MTGYKAWRESNYLCIHHKRTLPFIYSNLKNNVPLSFKSLATTHLQRYKVFQKCCEEQGLRIRNLSREGMRTSIGLALLQASPAPRAPCLLLPHASREPSTVSIMV